MAPQDNSPQAPSKGYRFIATGDPMCYWSSELAFTGATALLWKAGAAVEATRSTARAGSASCAGRHYSHCRSRWSLAWLRRGEVRAALANAALLPLLFADPGNTLYLNTFYAEGSALLAAYALFALTLLWRDAPRSALRFALLTLVAFVLATTKIQHLCCRWCWRCW